MTMKRVLLLGGGHTHIEVLRRLGARPMRDAEVTLVSPSEQASYSGMLPGLIAGHYTFEQTHISLRHLCERSGATLVLTRASAIRPEAHQVMCESGRVLDFDILSVDVGSEPSSAGISGATDHAASFKDVSALLERFERLASAKHRPGHSRRILVIGGGVGSVELALALNHRLAKQPETSVTIVGESLLPNHFRATQRAIAKVLKARGVAFECGRVTRIDQESVLLQDGRFLPSDLAVLATGPSAPSWIQESGLATDDLGYIAVDRFFRSTSHPEIFASGDVATLVEHPAPKSGVYAVRAAPTLAKNLRHAVEGSTRLRPFRPQRHALALIASGDKHATLSYGPIALSGNWVWHLKKFIDTRFIERYASKR